ncbi:hypothetical protein VAR608DRAFT_3465 [Variovorax sp. HW608]|jgi:hypothetical protein|uniref:hypothetical protein n=1 Tax=Variovorax sp. HW608 TaxID=1034889 RepID=UPI0008201A76|nr:hypothetical protein [Variovorax sp. HW608]SCK37569.1 hypothetical protein VAR608DRAFT_3465 [Variovorax sp. HW608]
MESCAPKDRERVLTGQIPFISLQPTTILPAAPVAFFEDGLDPAFGTEAWANAVFASASAGEGWSRSRMTHRHQILIDGEYKHIEGFENLAAYALNYLAKTGQIGRWKSQPFQWQLEKDGPLRVPDFLVELLVPPPRYLIIQVKAARFLTVAIQNEFERERAAARPLGVEHVVWTDKRPLDQKARNLFFRIRNSRQYPEGELVALVSEVEKSGSCTALQLAEKGHDPALLPIAIQQGRVFLDLRGSIHEQAIISTSPITDPREFLLCNWADPTSWWNSLPSTKN